MSDIRKLLNNIEQLSESSAGCSTAGSVATVAMPLGSTQKRVEEAAPEGPKVAVTPPEFASGGTNWGNWQNSVHSKFNKKSKKTKVKEAKQVDEVSKETIGSYIKKASQDLVDRATGSSFMSGKAGDKYNKSDDTPKEIKRKKGLARAVDKLVKEGSGYGEVIDPKLVSMLKAQGYKGPYQLGKLRKWNKELAEFADKEDEVMVQGNDLDYDGWVLHSSLYGDYVYGMEKMYVHGNLKKALKELAPEESLEEGADFGAYYYEQLAQKMFDLNPNFSTKGRCDELLNAAFPIAVKDLGKKRAQWEFGYDEDFPSDFVSAYAELQRGEQDVAEEATPEQKKWHKALKKAQQARLGKKSFTTRDLARIEKLEQEAEDIRKKGVAKKVDEAKLSEDDVVAKKYKADDVVSARNSGKADVAKAVESLELIAVASDEIIGSLRTTKRIPGWVSKSIAKALDELEDIASFVTTSAGVLEGAMKDIDIGRQDCESMTATQFKKAYGMTKAEWKAKNKKVLGGK